MTKIGSNSIMNENPRMEQTPKIEWNQQYRLKSRFWRRWKFHSYFSFAFSQQNWWCKELARSLGKCSPEAKLTLWRLSIYHDFKTRVLHHDSSKIVVVNNESEQKTVQRAYLKITKISHLNFWRENSKNPLSSLRSHICKMRLFSWFLNTVESL